MTKDLIQREEDSAKQLFVTHLNQAGLSSELINHILSYADSRKWNSFFSTGIANQPTDYYLIEYLLGPLNELIGKVERAIENTIYYSFDYESLLREFNLEDSRESAIGYLLGKVDMDETVYSDIKDNLHTTHPHATEILVLAVAGYFDLDHYIELGASPEELFQICYHAVKDNKDMILENIHQQDYLWVHTLEGTLILREYKEGDLF